jgi:CubicO group peptidase (beta-lactamase class C family)
MLIRRLRQIENPARTRRSDREVPAQEAGLKQETIEAIWDSVLAYYRLGLQPAMALCLRVHGKVVLDRAVGHARGNGPDDAPGAERIEASPDTPFNLFSASKPITAMLAHGLVERGLLKLDLPVAAVLPEFDAPGKCDITLRHVLSHRAGLPHVNGAINLDKLGDHAYIRAALGDLKMSSTSGKNLAYHALTGGYILSEMMREVSGKSPRTLQKKWVCEPLSMSLMNYGLTQEHRQRAAVDTFTGPPTIYPLSKLLEKALGMGVKEVCEVTSDARFLDAVVPSANIFATANEACRYFEMLRCGGELDGQRIFAPETVARAIAPTHFTEFDSVIKLPISYGLGFMLGNPLLSPFGPRSEQAFGHLGFTNVLVWADPKRNLSAALLNSGKPLITPEQLLWLNIPRVINKMISQKAAG